MVAKGNKDGHNRDYGYVSGRKTVELEKWGRDTATKRYGSLDYQHSPPPQPKDGSQPQKLGDRDNLPDPSYPRDAPKDWVRGFGKGGVEFAELMPNYDHLRGKEPTGRGRK